MNAMPALMPSVVARGPLLGDMTMSALWLHFMGLIVGLIGAAGMIREVMVYHTALRAATPARAERPVTAPQPAYSEANETAVQAA